MNSYITFVTFNRFRPCLYVVLRGRKPAHSAGIAARISHLEPVQVEKWLAFRDSCCLHLHFPARYLRPRPCSSTMVRWTEQMARRDTMHARLPTKTPRGTACPGCFWGCTPTQKCEREQRRHCKKKQCALQHILFCSRTTKRVIESGSLSVVSAVHQSFLFFPTQMRPQSSWLVLLVSSCATILLYGRGCRA